MWSKLNCMIAHPPILLVIWHSRTGAARQMAEAVVRGAREAAALMADDGTEHTSPTPARQVSARDEATTHTDVRLPQAKARAFQHDVGSQHDSHGQHDPDGAAALRQTSARQTEALDVRLCAAETVSAEHLRTASGYVFCAPENLATLSGAMKEFFDCNYYAVLDELAGRPYAAIIAAGTDGAGAKAQLERIATGWRLRQITPTLVFRNGAQTPEDILAPKTVPDNVKAQCAELGGLVGATLLL